MDQTVQEQPLPSAKPEEPLLPPETDDVAVAEPPVTEPLMDVTGRLAADFLLLAEEFPQLQSPAQLPDVVLDTAATENIPLLDAYLRYRWQEEKKVLAAEAKREQAAKQSAGSLSVGSTQVPPEQDAFLRAFRRAL